MIHHVKGCLGDTSPDFIILHRGTNDLNSNSTSEKIADKILNLIKGNAKMEMYRDYKTFNIDFFKRDLRESLENHTSYGYSCFQNIFIALLNKHAPIKKKIMHFNNHPIMSKALRKTIMHRSK